MVICYGVMLPESGRLSKLLVRKSAKTEAARGGFARSGALGLPGAGHVVAACLGVDLSKPEWCFVRWL